MIFAIGDVHGCAEELRELLELLPLTPGCTIVFLGDYIDRGPDSRGVVDTILELSRSHRVIALMGNHEEMFRSFQLDPESERAALFIYNGGSATLASYADHRGRYEIPEAHERFFSGLALYSESEDFFFVHAGVPEIPLSQVDPVKHRDLLLWTRGKFLRTDFTWEKVIVHGHTPVAEVTLWPNRINLDTGCVYDQYLSAIRLPDRALYSVKKKQPGDRVYLRDRWSRRRAVRFRGTAPVTVRRNGEEIYFETVDYSEVGLYMFDKTLRDDMILEENEQITGVIGTLPDQATEFDGVVVRRKQEQDGDYYAIKILATRAATPSWF